VKLDLLRRRNIWWPTWKGALLLLVVFVTPVAVWAWCGEAYLTRTERVAADTLIIESWIQADGLHAAAAEYRSGQYRHLVITGGLTGSKGALRRRSYAELALRELADAGVQREMILVAPIDDVDSQRTFAMATGVKRALASRNLHPPAVNVFTAGAHARRSQIVYQKAFGPEVKVGVISWSAAPRTGGRPWWTSSERTLELFKETIGYTYELLLDSGRAL
jgi:hypothetical protein